MRVTYHPDAEAELYESARFYDARVLGLGARFLAEVDTAVSTILEAPDRWPRVEGDLRGYSMAWFPYAIYYSVAADEILILVVKHHSRHPDYWRYRLP